MASDHDARSPCLPAISLRQRLARLVAGPVGTVLQTRPGAIACALAAVIGATALQAAELDASFDAYVVEAQATLLAIDAGKAGEQAPALLALVEHADRMIGPFIEHFPVCAGYLKAAQALKDSWSGMSLDRIEADYHDDGALPAIEDTQDRTLCYQMKDLLVHPLTGLRLLQEPDLDVTALRKEISEVASHGLALKALVAARREGF